MKRFFSSDSISQDAGLAFIRMIVGIFMIFHGVEVFDKQKMAEYGKWMGELGFSSPLLMAYLGKGSEFLSGIFLVPGLFTRLAVIPLAATMLIICFGMGKGRIFMEDQHPFLFVLLALVFFFTGGGKWSLDHILFTKREDVA
jgi:putative oxidoreductase